MSNKMPKIYCAGPLFNPKEREEMANIAAVLEHAGYSVFLPQRDGLELAKLLPVLLEKDVSQETASAVLNKAIFSLDVFEVMDSDGMILNMNGRVPDEGAMVEAGMAWAHEKPIVIFKNDDRSLIHGNCNPLVMGLADFEFVDKYESIPIVFDEKFSEKHKNYGIPKKSSFFNANEKGEAIRSYLMAQKPANEIAELLITLFGGVVCKSLKD
ncbi:MAG: nucleoside 2-deoxyribosyltransferase [Planctomycetes bacterium]|nr:nucleoside 2-deoxyribosyltransferase [Planctomycetota bacterium]